MLRLVSEETEFLCIIKAIRFSFLTSTGWLLLFFFVYWMIHLISLFSFLIFLFWIILSIMLLFSYSFLLVITYVSGCPYLPFMNYGVIRYVFGGLASLLLISFCFVLFFC